MYVYFVIHFVYRKHARTRANNMIESFKTDGDDKDSTYQRTNGPAIACSDHFGKNDWHRYVFYRQRNVTTGVISYSPKIRRSSQLSRYLPADILLTHVKRETTACG